jgi:hypothetical protein
MSIPAVHASKPPTAPATRATSSVRADDDAVRALAVAIHRELRESLQPEDVVRIASELLGRVAEELRERREGKPSAV